MYKKKKRILLMVFIVLSFVVGCTGKKTNTSCYILSVENAKSGTNYICDVGEQTFIYENKDNVCGIYDYETAELLIPFDDNVYFQSMAASDSQLVVYSGEDYGTLYFYSMDGYSMTDKISQIKVYSMRGDNDKIFIVAKEKGESAYDVMVVTDGGCIWLSEQIDKMSLKGNEGDYSCYQWDGYEINVLNGKIVYIENDNFQFSVSVDVNYVKSNGKIYSLEKQPSFLPDIRRFHGGVSIAMLSENNGFCYLIAQYSVREYQENPSEDFVRASVFGKYSLEDNKFEILYEAKSDEQIVGMSYEKKEIYIATDEGVYRKNIETNEESLLLKNRFQNSNARAIYYFEWYKDGMVVFSRDAKSENGPIYEGYFE